MDFSIESLGPRRIPSPIKLSRIMGDLVPNYVDDKSRVLFDPVVGGYAKSQRSSPSLEIAGPRETIYFDPSKVHAAIVTCGGLCPGINDVIRSIVMELWYWYGVRNMTGIRYGYRGFLPVYGHDTVKLTPDIVSDIHADGGTFLGTSRGGSETSQIVDALERMNINILFTIGGDGTQRGALAIHEELKKRKYKVAVIGIPKTIDNDISYVSKTFGLETAYSVAVEAMQAAHTEALNAFNGIGLVKLMGRDSGFIAANAALASQLANFVLIPEVPFDLEGPNGFLEHLRKRLENRHHALICVAEGAGRNLVARVVSKLEHDASGNPKRPDIGTFLSDAVKAHLNAIGMEFTLKYIDPSYIIRSTPAIPSDAIYCAILGQNAVHAAMAGKTGAVIGSWNGYDTHVPMECVIKERKTIDPDGMFWQHVVANTGQPVRMVNDPVDT
jgi:6-phosphofructokinase 1